MEMRNTEAGTRRIFKTSWGWLGMAATERGISVIVLPKRSYQTASRELAEAGWPINGKRADGLKHLRAGRVAIEAYLDGKSRELELPLDLDEQPLFRRKVWQILQTIPYGRVRSYGWVARKVGRPRAARAVGAACGANPVPLLVPCHRVVAGDGSLGGFSGGLPAKKQLLRLEGILFSPRATLRRMRGRHQKLWPAASR
jgi:methylated-DNA-[protein]-cysteine S-methyltransferase